MTNEVTLKIYALKEQGVGYKRIASELGLPLSTVKSIKSLFLEFKTKLLQKYSHNIGDISERELYKGGLTANEINQFLADVQGIGISRTTIQKIVNETVGEAISFNNEDIEDCPFVYLDASYIPFKRSIGIGKSVEKEGILVALGITPQGNKKILGYVIGETENMEHWKTLLRNLKEL